MLVRGTAALLAAGATFAVTAIGTTAVKADPTSTPRTYVAVGSDTTQDLYNSFGNGYVDGSGTTYPSIADIASYDATGPEGALGTTISPTNSLGGDCGVIGRPNGSGDGREFLSAAWSSGNHTVSQTVNGVPTSYTVGTQCIDIARASAALPTGGGDLTSVPLARDAVTVATEGFSCDFTLAELQAIFGAPNSPMSPTSANAKPVRPDRR